MKLYLVDWGNGMVGGFREEDLEQTFNTSRDMLSWDINYYRELYEITGELDEVYITYEQLNRMRIERGFELKSLL